MVQEKSLFERWSKGDTKAAEMAIKMLSGDIYKLCYRILNNHQDAEDATQVTFAKVCENLSSLDEIMNPRGWVAKIATNISLNIKRRRSVQVLQEVDDTTSTEQPLFDIEPSRLSLAIDLLDDDSKLPIVYKYQLGLSNSEIAFRLGITQEALRVRIYRAITKLRRMIKNE